MPDILVEVRGKWLADKKHAFLDAIHAALVEAIKIPAHDRLLRLVEHECDDFVVPPGVTERFTRIEITMYSGRSLDAKRRLYKAVTGNLVSFGVPPTSVKIALIEITAENWGVRGGNAACDIDLGFEVKV